MTTTSRRTCRGHDGMWPPKFRPNRSIDVWVIAFPTFSNTAAVRHLAWNFAILDHPRSQLCGSISLWKFGVDPIFPVGDIAILWFYQFGWKVPNHAPFWVFWGFEPLKIVGCHYNPQKAHPGARTRRLSHKRLKSVQGCDLGAIARKKYNQDRTASHKSVIFHIFRGKPPVKLSQRNFAQG